MTEVELQQPKRANRTPKPTVEKYDPELNYKVTPRFRIIDGKNPRTETKQPKQEDVEDCKIQVLDLITPIVSPNKTLHDTTLCIDEYGQ